MDIPKLIISEDSDGFLFDLQNAQKWDKRQIDGIFALKGKDLSALYGGMLYRVI